MGPPVSDRHPPQYIMMQTPHGQHAVLCEQLMHRIAPDQPMEVNMLHSQALRTVPHSSTPQPCMTEGSPSQTAQWQRRRDTTQESPQDRPPAPHPLQLNSQCTAEPRPRRVAPPTSRPPAQPKSIQQQVQPLTMKRLPLPQRDQPMSSNPGKRLIRDREPTSPARERKIRKTQCANKPPPSSSQHWEVLSDTTSTETAGEYGKHGVATGKYDPSAWNQLPKSMKTIEMFHPYQPPSTQQAPSVRRTHGPLPASEIAASNPTDRAPPSENTQPQLNPSGSTPIQQGKSSSARPSTRDQGATRQMLPSAPESSLQTQECGDDNPDPVGPTLPIVSQRQFAPDLADQGTDERDDADMEGYEEVRTDDPQLDPATQADLPPPARTLLEASINRIRGLEEIMQILPYICEPLHSALSRSAFNTQIPKNWFYVTLTQTYDHTDRAQTTRLRGEDPNLLTRFLEADVNILLRDPRVNGGHIRNFLRSKYGLQRSFLVGVLGIPSLSWLLEAIEDTRARPDSRYMTFILDKATQFGDPLVYCHYHTDPAGKAEIGRTDALTMPLQVALYRARNPSLAESDPAQSALLHHPPPQQVTREPIQVTTQQDQDRVSRLLSGRTTGARAPPTEQGTTIMPRQTTTSPSLPQRSSAQLPTTQLPSTAPPTTPTHEGSAAATASPDVISRALPKRPPPPLNIHPNKRERIQHLMGNLRATKKWESIEGVAAFRTKLDKQQGEGPLAPQPKSQQYPEAAPNGPIRDHIQPQSAVDSMPSARHAPLCTLEANDEPPRGSVTEAEPHPQPSPENPTSADTSAATFVAASKPHPPQQLSTTVTTTPTQASSVDVPPQSDPSTTKATTTKKKPSLDTLPLKEVIKKTCRTAKTCD